MSGEYMVVNKQTGDVAGMGLSLREATAMTKGEARYHLMVVWQRALVMPRPEVDK